MAKITVITDGTERAFNVAKPQDLSAYLTQIFPADPVPDTHITYVVTKQPMSRRKVI